MVRANNSNENRRVARSAALLVAAMPANWEWVENVDVGKPYNANSASLSVTILDKAGSKSRNEYVEQRFVGVRGARTEGSGKSANNLAVGKFYIRGRSMKSKYRIPQAAVAVFAALAVLPLAQPQAWAGIVFGVDVKDYIVMYEGNNGKNLSINNFGSTSGTWTGDIGVAGTGKLAIHHVNAPASDCRSGIAPADGHAPGSAENAGLLFFFNVRSFIGKRSQRAFPAIR